MRTGNRGLGAGRLTATSILPWVLALVFLLSAPQPARADIIDYVKGLFGAGDPAETAPDSESSGPPPEGSAAAAPCPENMLQFTGLSENCGTDRPPASHAAAGDLSGLWDIEAPGNPFHESALVSLNRGFAGLGYRSAEAQQWVAAGIARNHGDAWFGTINPTAKETEEGSLSLHLETSGFCGCVPYLVTVRRTADPNVLVGEWSFDYNKAEVKKGFAIARRRTVASPRSVSYRDITPDPAQRFVRDKAAFGTRPLKIERRHPVSCGFGQMKGNCGGIWVAISGDNLAGGHDVWIDPASHMQIDAAGWYCSNGDFRSYGAGWTTCGSTQVAGDGVVGLGIRLVFRDGMTPGPKTLWIDGRPVHLEMTLLGYPEEDRPQEPNLVLLDALNMQGEQITQVEEGLPFILKAVYDAAHPDSWISIEVPNVKQEGLSGKTRTAEVVLRRTADPKVFQSKWLAIEAGPAIR